MHQKNRLNDLDIYYKKNYGLIMEIDLDKEMLENLDNENTIGYISFDQEKIKEVINYDLKELHVILKDNDLLDKNLNFLETINKEINLIVEINYKENILKNFNKRRIKVVVSLPISDLEDDNIFNKKVWGIRIKNDSKLSKGEIDNICNQLENLKDDVIIYEIPDKEKIIEELEVRNTYQGFNRSILNRVKQIIEDNLQDCDLAVDMTVGNGHDTLFLANFLNKGFVFGFDIQEYAINNTLKLMKENNVNNYKLFLENHENINKTLNNYKGKIRLVLFNLGYLPGGDKTIMTNSKSTLNALVNSLEIINNRGIILIVCYPHEEGVKEANNIKQYLQKNDIHFIEYHNTLNENAPYLIEIRKN
ncbi:MAG: tRNA (mnm(5)s(2)U34)-methyltransferase [Bacilli bacterium]